MSQTLPDAPRPPAADAMGRSLVVAAAEVFAERGYEGAGVQEIARRAGVTTGAIYSRFSGKAELLAAAVADGAGAELDELFSMGEFGVDVAKAIRKLGRGLVDRPPDRKGALLLEAFIAARRDPEVADLMRRHVAAARSDFSRLVDVAQRRGDLADDVDTEALVHFEQALAIAREVGDRQGEGITHGSLATLHYDQGRIPEALEHYHWALAIHREVGDRRFEGITLGNLAHLHHGQGRIQEALEDFQQALAIAREVGHRRSEGGEAE